MSGVAYSVLDTAAVPQERRFALFSTGLGISHRIARVCGDDRVFDARIEIWALDATVISAGHQMALRIRRDERQIRTDGFNHVTLMMLEEGRGWGEAAGPIAFGVDEVAVLDMARPMDVTTSDNHNIGIRLPRQVLVDAGLPIEKLHGRVLCGTAGRLFSEHCRVLRSHGPSLRPADGPLVMRATVALFATAAMELELAKNDVAAIRPALKTASVRELVEKYVAQSLNDHELDTAAICRATNLSRSSLYRAMGRGGVASAIRRMRLDAIQKALRDPLERRGVAELSFAYGFADPAHFGTLFRRRYGCSPGAMRRYSTDSVEIAFESWLDALDGVSETLTIRER